MTSHPIGQIWSHDRWPHHPNTFTFWGQNFRYMKEHMNFTSEDNTSFLKKFVWRSRLWSKINYQKKMGLVGGEKTNLGKWSPRTCRTILIKSTLYILLFTFSTEMRHACCSHQSGSATVNTEWLIARYSLTQILSVESTSRRSNTKLIHFKLWWCKEVTHRHNNVMTSNYPFIPSKSRHTPRPSSQTPLAVTKAKQLWSEHACLIQLINLQWIQQHTRSQKSYCCSHANTENHQ